MKSVGKTILWIGISLFSAAVVAAMVLGYIMFWPLQPGEEIVAVKVKWGTGFPKITKDLHDLGIIRNEEQFTFTARLFKKTQSLKAGLFELRKNSSHYRALMDLVEGKQAYLKVTIPEGLTSRQIASILQRELEVDSARLVALVSDSAFIRQLGIDSKSLEGYLYPETYNFTFGLPEKKVISILVEQFKRLFADSLQQRCEEIGFTVNQALTLASIIEGEAMIDEEMPVISSVYHNRLKKGMRLQADPTIQYIIPDGPRRLLNRDLAIDSPYNTYMYAGLPPGPISNPGIKAIVAALYPAETNYIYFVADGSGGHIFSTNLAGHLRAKKKFDIIRRQVAQERKK